jgi:hypothetical protein
MDLFHVKHTGLEKTNPETFHVKHTKIVHAAW